MGKVVRLLTPVVVNESYTLSEHKKKFAVIIHSAVHEGTMLTLVLLDWRFVSIRRPLTLRSFIGFAHYSSFLCSGKQIGPLTSCPTHHNFGVYLMRSDGRFD